MTLTRAAKRRRAKAREICKSKRAYATDLEAAHTAGLQALKWNTKLFIYKCSVGDHWHLSRSAACIKVNKSTPSRTASSMKEVTTQTL